ncbi:oxidoreductase [Agathobaculum sp. Marseille-P7918]|uniref:oxidoreductase n=1 Tax=Agathobaculum sp. Marseille-P7918 TaxID=2479843 RepID=UPI000F642059|nr:FAD-dependent oxidoreductase [Agathobaculum sp. Marseille-P7918]
MKFPTMFSPIQIGTVTVPNRFVVPPMGNNFANTDGSLSDRSRDYYAARAKGGFGLITIESTVVYQEAKGGPRKPCLFSDDTVESFRQVADACHAYGAKVSIQLQHAGPEGNSALTGYPLKAASAVPAAQGREIPEAVSNEELYRIIECYGDAARRAQQAGIDMVEVHCAHGYLVSTFISQRTNHRTDEFGGCFENRMRLPRLIIENIRHKTGGNLPILCRINASDEVEGGQSVQDAAAVAAYLEQECGVDAIHVTRAVHLHDEFMWAPGVTHGGFNADLVSEIKRAVSVPVIAVGRFTEPQYAELLVKQGRADLIAFGRQSIADPELPNKARNGQLEELCPCIGCLLGCVPNMFAGKPITCAVNPCVGREADLKPAAQHKQVVVIGGGPGGLYAAWACAVRGHRVTLLEKDSELGGNFRVASFPTGKGQLSEPIRAMIVRAQKAGVDIRTSTEADEELLRALQPDAIILATGSTPLILPIPGLQDCGFVTAQDMLVGKAAVGKRVLVVGGGMVGCEAAEYLAERGHEVGIIEMKDVIAADVMPENRRVMFDTFERHHVTLRAGARVGHFYPDGVDYTLADGTVGSMRGYDNVVLAMGSRSNAALKETAERIAPQVLVIGEAAKAPGNAVHATGDALDAALQI